MEEFDQNNSDDNIGIENSVDIGDNPDLKEEKRLYNAEKVAYNCSRRFSRGPLILALIGMAVSFLYGVGIVFAIVALIKGAKRYAIHPSRTLKWAVTISIICIVLCSIYIICLVYAVIVASSYVSPEVIESIENIIRY